MRYREEPYDEPTYGTSFSIGRRRHSSVVTWLIIINVVVYVVELLIASSAQGDSFLALFGLVPQLLFHYGFAWQLVTYAFLHDPRDLTHILFNMLFLYWFGRGVEQVWGARRFVAFYLAAAAFAGLLFAGLEMVVRPENHFPCIGASGAVMAVLMVYGLWWPDQVILFMFIFPMRIRYFILITIGIEFLGVLNLSRSRGVANMAHLGGLLFGYLVVRFGPRLGRLAEALPALSRRPRFRDGAADERRLDEILEKVHVQGMGALSWRERRFLKRMSRRREG